MVIRGQHIGVGRLARGLDRGLVMCRQFVPLGQVEHGGQGRTAFPIAGIMINRSHFEEASLFIVIGANPFGRVDGAFFQRLIDFAARDLLRYNAELFQNLASKATHAHFQALHIGQRGDLFAIPAAHLRAGVASGKADQALGRVEFVQHVLTAAVVEPSVHLTGVHAERRGAAERKGRVLAPEVIGRGVGRFDGASGHGVCGFKRRNQFTSREDLQRQPALGHFADVFRHGFGSAVNRVKGLGERRGDAPRDLGVFLCNGRCGKRCSTGCGDTADSCLGQKGTTIHITSSSTVGPRLLLGRFVTDRNANHRSWV